MLLLHFGFILCELLASIFQPVPVPCIHVYGMHCSPLGTCVFLGLELRTWVIGLELLVFEKFIVCVPAMLLMCSYVEFYYPDSKRIPLQSSRQNS